jgi:hypothetical protein
VSSQTIQGKTLTSAPLAASYLTWILLITCFAVSVIAKDFAWLARAGCLITVVAILLTFSLDPDVFAQMRTNSHLHKLVTEKIPAMSSTERYMVRVAKHAAGPKEDTSDPIVIWLRTELALRALRFTIMVRQVKIAALGTFLWGFGDLPNKLLAWPFAAL